MHNISYEPLSCKTVMDAYYTQIQITRELCVNLLHNIANTT